MYIHVINITAISLHLIKLLILVKKNRYIKFDLAKIVYIYIYTIYMYIYVYT